MKISRCNKKLTLSKRISTVLLSTCMFATTAVFADDSTITIIQVSDLHGNLVPHAGVIINTDGSERIVTQGGGIAKVATIVNEIRADNPDSLALAVGDTVHGNVEVLFTMGDAIMPAFNALGLDAYTPGNWEFGYGPVVFRHRFAPRPPYPPLPANVQVMINADGVPGVSKANFPVLAINLYNAAPLPPQLRGKRVLDPYKIFEVNGTKVAVIGITAAIVPQQSPVFSAGFKFTQGYTELPGIIDQVQAAGATIIVVQSELGLPQNVQLGREFKSIDIILSAHSHEVTLGAILADANGYSYTTPDERLTDADKKRLKKGAAIIVEAGEDLYVGRLDLKVEGGKIKDFAWQAIPVDDDIAEDPTIKALVDEQEEYFIAGKDGKFIRHSYLPVGFCPANECGDTTKRGHQLVDDIDTIVGSTDILLRRHDLLEGVMNNFIADSVRATLDPVVANQTEWSGVDISMTNGFRFDTPILSANDVPAGKTFRDGRAAGEITLRDLYAYFPLAPALV
ncbi:MAG: bifunctional UDP-sugar hydrolase/5'-nucleotidase, partial [Thiohalomonadales bacterium]